MLAAQPEAQEQVLELLTNTGWDGEDLRQVRGVRDLLCGLLVLALPGGKREEQGGEEGGGRGKGRKGGDELASYAALVKEMGY